MFQPAELKSIPGSLRFRSNLCEEEGTLLPGESGVFALLLQSRGADVYDVGRGSLRLSREYFERANELLQGKLASLTENLLLYSYSSTKKNESELLLSRLLSLLADTTTFQRGCSQLQLFVEGTFSESEIRSFLLREAPEIIHSQSASG